MPIFMKYDAFLNANQFAGTISGLSNRGAYQFLDGQIITDAGDRRALAGAMFKKLGLAAITDGTSNAASIGLLRPAEKNGLIGLLRPAENDVSIGLLRQAAQEIRKLTARSKSPLNLTEIGLLRFLSGDFVPNPQDRSALAIIMTDFFALPYIETSAL